jgi:hypothetical protein
MEPDTRTFRMTRGSAILLLLLFFVESAIAQSIDGEVKKLVTAVRARDAITVQESLVGAAVALEKLQRTVKPLQEVSGILTNATKILSAAPVELDFLVEAIEKDTNKIEGIRPAVPAFGLPMLPQAYPDLNSADPQIRGVAIGKWRTESNALRDQYAQKLSAMISARDQARRLLQQAETATDNGIKVEKILDDLNGSKAGPLFNMGGGRLVYTLLDMSLYVRPALQLRENACRDLVKRYDSVITEMRARLDRFRNLDQWASFYMWQDWVRMNAGARPQTLQDQMNGAASLAQKADSLGKSSQANGTTAWLLNQTVLNTNATMAKAQALIDNANAADAKAASQREFNALLQLASAVDGASSSQSRENGKSTSANAASAKASPMPPLKQTPPPSAAPPIVIFQTIKFEFKLVPEPQATERIP